MFMRKSNQGNETRRKLEHASAATRALGNNLHLAGLLSCRIYSAHCVLLHLQCPLCIRKQCVQHQHVALGCTRAAKLAGDLAGHLFMALAERGRDESLGNDLKVL